MVSESLRLRFSPPIPLCSQCHFSPPKKEGGRVKGWDSGDHYKDAAKGTRSFHVLEHPRLHIPPPPCPHGKANPPSHRAASCSQNGGDLGVFIKNQLLLQWLQRGEAGSDHQPCKDLLQGDQQPQRGGSGEPMPSPTSQERNIKAEKMMKKKKRTMKR